MTNNNDKTLKALHDLAATCNDASEGYAKAAKGVRNTDLSNWLTEVSTERDQFASDLGAVIRKLGGESGADLHEGGILHRGWVDLEQNIRSKDEHEILEECLAGDSGTLKHYDHALTLDIPSEFRSLVIEQRVTVQDNLTALDTKAKYHKSQHA